MAEYPIDPNVLDAISWHYPLVGAPPEDRLRQELILEILETKVPPRMRTCIELRLWAGQTYEEIAQQLGCTKQTAWRHYRQGIIILRKELENAGMLPPD